jgi:uncharacterized protein YjbK
MREKEVEIKLDLGNQGNYRRLLDNLHGTKRLRKQENHFFDTDDWSLSKAGWALRVRKANSRATLTLKGPHAQSGALTVRPEIETDIPFEVYQAVIARGILWDELPRRIRDPLDYLLPGPRLEKKLSFITDRWIVDLESCHPVLTLEVDKTGYADGTFDYELEVELEDTSGYEAAMKALKKIFKEIGIPVKPLGKSKLVRAMEKGGSSPKPF